MNEIRSSDNISGEYNYLERIRKSYGIDMCKAIFHDVWEKTPGRAVELLNDRNLTFPCLYILAKEIESLNLYPYLNFRNTEALRIIDQTLKLRDMENNKGFLQDKETNTHQVLKWIMETGNKELYYDDDYDEVLDVVISVLINVYKDKSILPETADMIFKRNKAGRNIHGLIWGFFCIKDPCSLKLIAEYIRSAEGEEAELALELLGGEVPDLEDKDFNRQNQYEAYIKYLEENEAFLYFTEEGPQYSSRPEFFKIDFERKYLNKATPSYEKEPVIPEDEEEGKWLKAFKPLKHEEKTVLSEYSCKLHNKNISKWKQWIKSSVNEQIMAANAGTEELK